MQIKRNAGSLLAHKAQREGVVLMAPAKSRQMSEGGPTKQGQVYSGKGGPTLGKENGRGGAKRTSFSWRGNKKETNFLRLDAGVERRD